jgi:hypothetical protein
MIPKSNSFSESEKVGRTSGFAHSAIILPDCVDGNG